MNCYQVTQSFFNSGLGVEGRLGEYLEMSIQDAGIIGKRYLKGVTRDTVRSLKERRVKPRIVSISDRVKLKCRVVPDDTDVTDAPNKLVKPRRGKVRTK